MDIFNNKGLSYEILFNLSPFLIKRNRILNKNINNIYNDENFWKLYCQNNYFITVKPEKYIWRNVSFWGESFLISLFNDNVFPTFRILQIIILFLKDYDVPLENFSYFYRGFDEREFIKITNLDNLLYDYLTNHMIVPGLTNNVYNYLDEHYNLDCHINYRHIRSNNQNLYNNQQFLIEEYSHSGLKGISKILKIIKRPTVYFIPSKITDNHLQHYTINYDSDLREIISNSQVEKLETILISDSKLRYIEYFIDSIKELD